MNDSFFSTTSTSLAGYTVTAELGVVRGVSIRLTSTFGELRASIQAMTGSDMKVYLDLCDKARAEAFNKMIAEARQHGANGVIGIRYDSTEIQSAFTEIFCYGTAVVVKPIPPKAVASV